MAPGVSVDYWRELMERYFSNSLMIHQVKIKKITTVKEVLIPGLSEHRF